MRIATLMILTIPTSGLLTQWRSPTQNAIVTNGMTWIFFCRRDTNLPSFATKINHDLKAFCWGNFFEMFGGATKFWESKECMEWPTKKRAGCCHPLKHPWCRGSSFLHRHTSSESLYILVKLDRICNAHLISWWLYQHLKMKELTAILLQ